MARTPAETPSKAAKIWKRTRVGGSIAIGLALILWAASAIGSALPVLAVALVVLGACIFEVSRMGSLRGRKLGWILGVPAAFVALAMAHDLRIADVPASFGSAASFCHAVLLHSTSIAAVAALCAFAFVRSQSLFARGVAVAAVVVNLLGDELSPAWEFAALVLLLFLVARFVLLGGAALRRETIAIVVLGALLVVSMPALAVAWRAFGHLGLVALLVIAKVGDTAGYYVGSTLGRHKPFKSISPNKTAEGCVGSLIASSLVGAAAVALGWLPSEPYGLLGGALAGALVNVAAQASDLLESWVKRKAGVKDSGTWFSTSGGMLDLVDSFFLATPIALIAWPVVFNFSAVSGFGE